ncbi:MAG: FIST C-terminal domain-containing protein [Planctomycetes bacterium]|nr:FIST C-terminal domain-containing protein [Planctomycetota bacterium]
MKWASALTQSTRLSEALPELASQLSGLDEIDLLVAFISPHYRERALELSGLLRKEFGPKTLIGCSAVGVVGTRRELELEPGIVLAAAHLPGVTRTAVAISQEDLPSPDAGPGAWIERLGIPQDPKPHFVILSDPTSSDPTSLLEGLDFAYPESAKIGGLASDGSSNALFLDDRVLSGGTVVLGLSGNLEVEPIVAQGCRPIGAGYRITGCKHNFLLELDGRRPTQVLEDIYEELAQTDQEEFLHRSLHLGVATTGLLEEGQEPEYLIRNVLGADPRRGALAIGANLRQGQQVRFHLRDAEAARADLTDLLGRYTSRSRPVAPAGALLFACAGRGRHLFGEPNCDAVAFADAIDVPLAGFFCAGEIGPVGGSTSLLGYTSSFGVFRSASEDVG